MKPKRKNFGLFRYFEPISKQPKQTGLFRDKPKQTETTQNFWKNFQIYSLLNWVGLLFVSVQSKLSVSVKKRNNRNKRFVSESAETSFGSSFGCFETKLVSKDTLSQTSLSSLSRPASHSQLIDTISQLLTTISQSFFACRWPYLSSLLYISQHIAS